MGIFGNSSPFDQDVEKATNENNSSEDWALILEICDRAGAGATAARDCLRAVTRRLAHTDPHVQLKAATLLDACVSNCGRNFLLEVASRDFLHEFRRLLARAQPPVARRLRGLLKKWAENEFKGDPQLDLVPSLYLKLRVEGHDFETNEPTAAPAQAATSAAAAREHDDLARAIELSLRESGAGAGGGVPGGGGTGGAGGGALYPRVEDAAPAPAPAPAVPAPRKVRALYDFEAAEDNELTFLAGEILWVTDASDPNWWKGSNERGEGLFPANFVSADLEPAPKIESRSGGKSVQFAASSGPIQEEEEEPEIDEAALDAALLALHEASPEAPAPGEEDLARHEVNPLKLEEEKPEIDKAALDAALLALHEASPEAPAPGEEDLARHEVNPMAGVVDAALQRADARHARLTQLSAELVDALNLYHHLMREPLKPYNMPQPHIPGVPPGVPGVPGPALPPHLQQLHYFPPPGPQHPPGQPPQPRC
ncbi:signal transducing adapter molecule 1 [Cydia fagiglandana]|uniref:signal transducing adapter molecule 1 n=1 Tax=Cydia fagiglandana TaxID=1458189 RepID=UPI002FEE63A8